jgi:hypothetical protein
MLEFCPHCGELGGLRQKGQALICSRCGKKAGDAPTPLAPIVLHQADELIRQGAAAHCPACRQLVELRGAALARHFTAERRVCPGSGKPQVGEERPAGKDLAAYMTRESVRVVSCRRGAAPQIEELALAYLDRSDRVRVQIDALRDILGPQFRLRDYPPSLNRPQLAVWASATACLVGKKHGQGGYQPMSDAELTQVAADLQQHTALFFG